MTLGNHYRRKAERRFVAQCFKGALQRGAAAERLIFKAVPVHSAFLHRHKPIMRCCIGQYAIDEVGCSRACAAPRAIRSYRVWAGSGGLQVDS